MPQRRGLQQCSARPLSQHVDRSTGTGAVGEGVVARLAVFCFTLYITTGSQYLIIRGSGKNNNAYVNEFFFWPPPEAEFLKI
jgi:hypothetical protein